MFLRICKVQFDSNIVKHCILEWFEFVVTSDFGDSESSFVVKMKIFTQNFFVAAHQFAFTVLCSLVA
jgi:hypothetical protein